LLEIDLERLSLIGCVSLTEGFNQNVSVALHGGLGIQDGGVDNLPLVAVCGLQPVASSDAISIFAV